MGKEFYTKSSQHVGWAEHREAQHPAADWVTVLPIEAGMFGEYP